MWSQRGGGTDDGTLWQIQGGVAQELDRLRQYRASTVSMLAATTCSAPSATTVNSTHCEPPDNEYTMWGLGVVQNIDAAAMEIYLAYRRHASIVT